MRHPDPRPAYSRAALMLVALLSVVLLGGVQSASCEMHGLGAAQRSSVDHAAMAHSAADGMAADEQTAHRHDRSDPGCDCTCIGDCSMVAPLAIAPAAVTIRVALTRPEPHRPIDAEPSRAPPAAPDRLLPFANGPPDSALA